MSIRAMSLVWDLDLPHGEKLVLLSLADQANDAGICWPSIGTMQRRCGYSERGLRDILANLERRGFLSRQHREGRATLYTLTPAVAAGVQQADPGNGCPPPRQSLPGTPAMAAGDPGNGCPQNPKEPKENPQGNQRARGAGLPMPEGVNAEAFELWTTWLSSKGKPVNEIQRPLLAMNLVAFGDADKQSAVVRHSINRGWVSLHAPRDADRPTGKFANRKSADELEAEARAKGVDPYELERP